VVPRTRHSCPSRVTRSRPGYRFLRLCVKHENNYGCVYLTACHGITTTDTLLNISKTLFGDPPIVAK
jgi:hypothetical protein